MKRSAMQLGIRRLRQKLAAPRAADESDEQLLHAFLHSRDEAAFAVVVRRHGPMVLHVCRRVLGHQQDAEDAFQATFLVLARNAASLHNKIALASWLHGTAYRIAMKAKQSAARRRKYEGQTPTRSSADPSEELSWREVRALLDEEIARLPETYRSVFVLCCLENLSQAEAGKQLGLKERTVSNRLAAARKRLAQRLARRGVELTAVLAATSLATPSAPPLSAGLTASTIQAVLETVASEGVAGVVSASVAELVKDASVAMMVSKAKIATVVLLAMGMLAGASVWAYRSEVVNALPSSAQPVEPPRTKTNENKAALPKWEAAKTVEIKGRVLDPDGKPKARAKLLLLSRESKMTALGVTAADGRFTVAVPKETMNHWGDGYLIAQADSSGLDFVHLFQWKRGNPVELRLVKDNAIRGRVVNTEGKPVRGVRVATEKIGIFANNSLDNFLAAGKNGLLNRWGEKTIWSGAGALLAATTNADGRFVLPGIGAERTAVLRLRGTGIADTFVLVVNRAGFDPKPYNQAFLDRIRSTGIPHGNWRWSILSGPDISVVAQREKILRGTVRDADTGKGRPGVVVRLVEDSDEYLQFPPEARADAQGNYEMRGIRKTEKYLLAVSSDPATGYVGSQVWAEDTTGDRPLTADIRVKKGVIITGKVIDGGTGKPIPGFACPTVLAGNPFVKDYPKFRESMGLQDNRVPSDDKGQFRVVTLPGPVVLMGGPHGYPSPIYKRPLPDPKYPQYFSVRDPRHPKSFLIRVHPETSGFVGGLPLGNFCKVLEIKPGEAMVEQDIVVERAKVRSVALQDAEGRPLAGTWAAGFAPEDFHPARQIKEVSCSAYGELDEPKLLVFYHPDKKLVGTRRLKGDEKEPIVVKLGPVGAFKGQLLDTDGKPLSKIAIKLRYRDREAVAVQRIIEESKQIVTDTNGGFTFDTVMPELKFELAFRRGIRRFERETKTADSTIQVRPGECRDLGAIKLKPISQKAGE
jgi:RNA polymerase sigma factor (sigma-70 family)